VEEGGGWRKGGGGGLKGALMQSIPVLFKYPNKVYIQGIYIVYSIYI